MHGPTPLTPHCSASHISLAPASPRLWSTATPHSTSIIATPLHRIQSDILTTHTPQDGRLLVHTQDYQPRSGYTGPEAAARPDTAVPEEGASVRDLNPFSRSLCLCPLLLCSLTHSLFSHSIPPQQLLTIEGREKDAARTLLARGEKARALSALRRGKYQRSMLEKTDGQLKTLEELVSTRSEARSRGVERAPYGKGLVVG